MHTYIDDLSDLEDVLDEIEEEIEDDSLSLSIGEEMDFINTLMVLMYDYINENPCAISEPDFEDSMLEDIELLFDLEEDILEEALDSALVLFYSQIIPMRSHPKTFSKSVCYSFVEKQIEYLRGKPQPDQRTPEWYVTRHNLLTASNAYKAFENDTTRNQLIYEKCQPLKVEPEKQQQININSPFHWGQKFEPVSVLYYEDKYKTKIGDFGCIQHDKYKFIGASPDGINVDPLASRYGRLLEIKNIVNREIDGIPKKEYWIQMQLQMETCNLNECDFLECRFKEYETETEFMNDGSFAFSEKEECRKGVIMYFCNKDGNPKYIYMPFSIKTKEAFEEWEQETMEYYSQEFTWIKNIYWYLAECSCVLVERNKKWFNDNVEKLEEVWNIIEKERVSGFEHRAANKRVKKPVEQNNRIISSIEGCFLKIIKSNSSPPTVSTLKVRTESFDESKINL
jgi:putative phage-type endonuclease